MNKKGAVALPWTKIITYLIILLVFIFIVIWFIMLRGTGIELSDLLFGK